MVRFAVFNDYSLPFLSDKNIKEKFIEFFKLLAEINNKGLSTLRVPNELKERYVLDGINFKQFIGQQRDQEFKRKIRQLFQNYLKYFFCQNDIVSIPLII
jgi:hypothetical protein